ncbi:MAG TPA: TadE/TadG family type IV pilus assembly protein [Acidimicrobiales bacterium]|nr:TadE/TadG family type IV pilus assembly protein [Acidimicrobiales bacterium]
MNRTRRARGTRGAALVEAAIITPLFILLLFGVIEYGYGFLDRLTAKNASLVGARAGASEGTNGDADYDILQAVKKASQASKAASVKYVIIYKASSYSASVPAACLTASQTGVCNRYTGADFSLAETNFGCATGDRDIAWCPSTRKTALGGANGPPDYLGVYVQIRHDNITGLFGSGYDFKSDSVVRMEPTRLA